MATTATKKPFSAFALRFGAALALLLGAALAATPAEAAERRLGIGIHYWETFDGLPSSSGLEDIEDSGQSLVLSYQSGSRFLFRYQIDLEYFDDGFSGSTEAAVAPQFFLVAGGTVYGAVGLGVTISDGLDDDVSDPFYMARVGLDIGILGAVDLDINATYRFEDWDALEDLDLDTDGYTLGAVARFRF